MRGMLRLLNSPAAMSTAGQAGGAALGFLSFLVLARLLAPAELGAWVLYLTAATLLEMLRAGIVQTALVRSASTGDSAEVKTVYGSAWVLALAVTAVLVAGTFVAGFLLGPHIGSPAVRLFTTWWPFVAIASLPAQMGSWMLQAERRFGRSGLLRLAQNLIFLAGLSIGLVLPDLSLDRIAAIQLLAHVTAALLGLGTGWAQLSSVTRARKDVIRSLFRFGKFSMGTLIGTNLLKSADAFILGAFLGPAAVALYAIPQKIVEAVEVPLRGLAAATFPEMSAASLRGDLVRLRHLFERWVGMLTLALLPVLAVAWWLAPEILSLLGGAEYARGADLLRLFLVYIVLLPADRYLGLALDALGKPHLNLYKVLVMVVVNIAGDLAAVILLQSVTWVAATTVLMTLTGTVFGARALGRVVSVRPMRVLSRGWAELGTAARLLLTVIRPSLISLRESRPLPDRG